MPYKNIIFTKLRCELITDERFTDKLDDEGKLMFFCLLLLAGVKENKIPDDAKWLKRTLNLSLEEQKIREKLQEIFKTFSKTFSKNGFIKFKNYSKLHNPLGKSEGTPQDVQRMDKIYKIIEEYIKKKRYIVINEDGSKNQEVINALIKRNLRTTKRMLLLTKGDPAKIIKAMEWFGDICDQKGFSWTLETIEKWLPEYLSKGEAITKEAIRKEFGLK